MSISHIVNIGFSSLIILLAIAGYILTSKRMGEKWLLWIILATGWALFAICNIFTIGSLDITVFYAIWLSSYVMVMASLVLLFLKLIQVRDKR